MSTGHNHREREKEEEEDDDPSDLPSSTADC